MKITRVERAKSSSEHERPPLWLVGITDLTTLILAFFIMLFATTQTHTKPMHEATESLRTRFGGEENINDTRGEVGNAKAEKNWESNEQDPGLNLSYLYSVIKKYTSSAPDLKDMTLWQDRDTIVLSFPTELCFEPGQSELSDYGKRAIAQISALLSKLPNTIKVVGHADPTPLDPEKRFNSNWHLSLARALAVTQALQEEGYPLKIETRGRGTTDADQLPWNMPVSVRNEKSRRVDIHVSLLKP